MIILGLVFFSGGLVVSLIMPFFEPKLIGIWWIWIPVIVGYYIFAKMFIDAWKERKNFVKLDGNAISLHSPENLIETIKWNYNNLSSLEKGNLVFAD